jgi:hypothetical protein
MRPLRTVEGIIAIMALRSGIVAPYIELLRLNPEYKWTDSTALSNRIWGSWPNIPSKTFTVKLYDMLTTEHGTIIIVVLVRSTFVPRRSTPQHPQ